MPKVNVALREISTLIVTTQVQSFRKLALRLRYGSLHRSGSVPIRPETGQASRFGFVGVDREGRIMAPARVRHVVCTAAKGTSYPCIHDIKDERAMHGQGGMQRGRRLPRLVAHAGDELPVHSC